MNTGSSCPPPAREGWVLPPEWAPHEATWIAWPRLEDTWRPCFDSIPAVFADLALALAPGEEVRVLVEDSAMETAARDCLARRAPGGAAPAAIRFFHAPNNDSWIRDYGPLFLTRGGGGEGGGPLLLDWEFNAWGAKEEGYEFDLDNETPRRIADWLGLERRAPGRILEGGAIEVDGEGLLLTSESCLLNPNRNPGMSREEVEAMLRDWLGARKILWLGRGVEGDDTEGHVDELARFVAPGVVLATVEPDPQDVNYEALRDNRERLARMRDLAGRPLTVLELEMPGPVVLAGRRLPASYLNFYIGNAAVVVPQFGWPERDRAALERLAALFPTRRIVGIPCAEMTLGGGALHCVTMQQPRP